MDVEFLYFSMYVVLGERIPRRYHVKALSGIRSSTARAVVSALLRPNRMVLQDNSFAQLHLTILSAISNDKNYSFTGRIHDSMVASRPHQRPSVHLAPVKKQNLTNWTSVRSCFV